jgi:hypothetical protein
MAVLYLDSFAHQNTGRYVFTNGPQWFTTAGRILGFRYKGIAKRAVTPSTEIFCGVGFLFGSAGSIMSFWGDTQATQHITVMVNASGRIEVRLGSTTGTLLATGSTVITGSTWTYVEARCVLSDTVGVVQVRLNGATTNEVNYTGDTRNAGTAATIDGVDIGTTSNNSYSDWYIADTTGTVSNSWLGDTVIRPLVPAGDGDLSQLLGSDGNSVSNWQQVDELPASGADYNAGSTAGLEDTYAVTDLPSQVSRVSGVQIAALMAKSDVGTTGASIIARVAGTDYTPGAKALSTSFTEFLDVWTVNPATSAAWAAVDVNALQVGMKVT